METTKYTATSVNRRGTLKLCFRSHRTRDVNVIRDI